MSLLDLGMTMEEAAKESTGGGFEALPEAEYEVVIEKMEERPSRKGRPILNITFSIINNPDYNNRKLFHSCPLPWINESGDKDVSGIGILADVVKGCGLTWDGTAFDTDNLFGAQCKVFAVQEPKKDMSGNVVLEGGVPVMKNRIKRVYA